MSFLKLLSLLLLFAFSLSCSCKKKQEVPFIGEVKKLVRKTPQQIAGVLGKGKSKEKVTGFPCENSDCDKRSYRNGQFVVLYKNKKSDRIVIHKVPDLTEYDHPIESLGLSGYEPFRKTPKSVVSYQNVEKMQEIIFYPDSVVIQVTVPD